MAGAFDTASSLDSVAHIIQIALTPVFLLSGIATLLNVFAARLARVADRVDRISEKLAGGSPPEEMRLQLAYLRRRSLILDFAVVIASIGGAATCGAALTLFIGALRDTSVAALLFVRFGIGIACTICALAAFVWEMLIAGRGLRVEASRKQDTG